MTSPITFVRECNAPVVIETWSLVLDHGVSRRKRDKASEADTRTIPTPTSRFFPVSSLRNKVFDHDKVTSILNHPCEECESHLRGNEQLSSSTDVTNRILKSDAALSLFALLVVLKHPRLILVFLSSVDNDLMLPRYFPSDQLQDVHFRHLPRGSRDSLIESFEFRKWQFSAPQFDHGSFTSYPEGTVLPFLDEKEIGRGGHGAVYKVWIHPNYCNLPGAKIAGKADDCPGAKILVRKEIIGEDRIAFVREWANLERILTLKDPHLIEIQKTYQLNDKLNILFPCAKTNLFDYLREKRWAAPRTPLIRTNSLWVQVLGITNALSKIINFKAPGDEEVQLFGSHSDLKPQNILVDSSAEGSEDSFKITDFGQTIWIDPAFATSSRPATSGTDAYCPPELMSGRRNKTYDIWSLGIIVLEVLAFAIWGRRGLTDPTTGLDHIRKGTEGRHSHHRFYAQGPQGRPILKKSISDWMAQICNGQFTRDVEDKQFVQTLIELCRRMLEPNMRSRITIEDVLPQMQSLFQVTIPESQDIAAASLKKNDEVVLVDLRDVGYHYAGTTGKRSVSFVMLENKDHIIRTFVQGAVHPAKDERQNMELLLPFQHSREASDDTYEVRFQPVKGGHATSLSDVKLVLRNWTVAQRLQMALTGHNISNRYYLEKGTIFYYQTPFEYLMAKPSIQGLITKLSGKSKQQEHDNNAKRDQETVSALCIELWEEKPQTVSEIVASSTESSHEAVARRAKRQVDPGRQVALGRVVVYCDDRILIMPFSRASRIERHDDMKQLRMKQITFEPMDPKQSESFPISFLTASASDNRGKVPGIPMFHKKLYEEEDRNGHACVKLQIHFKSPDDASEFYWLYRNQKARWLDLTRGVQPKNKSLMPQN